MDVVTALRRPSVVYLTICWQWLVEGTMLVFLMHCLLINRLTYTLSPYHSSSLYTVSLLVFLIHCLFTRPPYTLSPYSSSLYTVSLSLVFLIHYILARLPYKLSPYHASSLYTVSLSRLFLIHGLLITPLLYTLSPYHSSSLYTVSSLIFLPTPRFVLGFFLRLFAAFCCLLLVCFFRLFAAFCCLLLVCFFRLFAAFCCLFLVCFSVCLLLSVVCLLWVDRRNAPFLPGVQSWLFYSPFVSQRQQNCGKQTEAGHVWHTVYPVELAPVAEYNGWAISTTLDMYVAFIMCAICIQVINVSRCGIWCGLQPTKH